MGVIYVLDHLLFVSLLQGECLDVIQTGICHLRFSSFIICVSLLLSIWSIAYYFVINNVLLNL